MTTPWKFWVLLTCLHSLTPTIPLKIQVRLSFYSFSNSECLVTKRRVKRCANKLCGREGVGHSSKDWSRRKLGEHQFFWLCKPCSTAYKNNQYCDFCRQIYMETGENAETDGKEWVQCEQCEKWVHTDCEVSNGYTRLQELVNQDEKSEF